MAKGDEFRVVFPTGATSSIRAEKAGRRLTEPRYYIEQKVTFVEIKEVTRGGTPTGKRLIARLDQIGTIEETVSED